VTIFRVKHGPTNLDFGSQQSANQFLDNYPPHVRDQVVLKEADSQDIKQSIEEYTRLLRQATRFDSDGNPIQTSHTEWLLSRLDMYEKALPTAEQFEANLRAKEAARVNSGYNPVVQEVWRPDR
jgi:hypothetical protein